MARRGIDGAAIPVKEAYELCSGSGTARQFKCNQAGQSDSANHDSWLRLITGPGPHCPLPSSLSHSQHSCTELQYVYGEAED
jgi:hypothetical protein